MNTKADSRLTAAHLPRVTYFFGLPGAGKSYLAELLSKETGVYWHEADSDLPNDILESIRNKIAFTEVQRDKLYAYIRDRILSLLATHEKLIVSQATFKARHRAMLRDAIQGLCFVWVQAPKALIQERLTARGGKVDVQYALDIAQYFEPPSEKCTTIVNDSNQLVMQERLKTLFNR